MTVQNTLARSAQSERGYMSYLSFRTMVSTTMIKLIYTLGAIGISIAGVVFLIQGFDYDEEYLLLGLGIFLLGNILWRLVCEGIIILFSMHELLGSILKELKK